MSVSVYSEKEQCKNKNIASLGVLLFFPSSSLVSSPLFPPLPHPHCDGMNPPAASSVFLGAKRTAKTGVRLVKRVFRRCGEGRPGVVVWTVVVALEEEEEEEALVDGVAVGGSTASVEVVAGPLAGVVTGVPVACSPSPSPPPARAAAASAASSAATCAATVG